MKEIKIF